MENHLTEMFCASDVGSSLGGCSIELCCLEARCADSLPGPPRVADAVVVVAGGREGGGVISVGRAGVEGDCEIDWEVWCGKMVAARAICAVRPERWCVGVMYCY